MNNGILSKNVHQYQNLDFFKKTTQVFGFFLNTQNFMKVNKKEPFVPTIQNKSSKQ